MNIYQGNGTLLVDIEVDDSSYRNRQLMGDNSVVLHFSLPSHLEIPVGSYIEYQSETYFLDRPENLKMMHSRLFEYTVTFESRQSMAKRWIFRNPADGRLKFPLTATAREHLQMFVDNMNRRDSGWSIGSCVDTPEHLISYDSAYCFDALQQMASEFETEFEIRGRVVSLGKVEYNRSAPLSLSYGKGNGFKGGITRNVTGDMPVEILYVQGGTRNIDPSTYGNRSLLLPVSEELGFDGQHFSDETGYDQTIARTYETDEDGLYVRRSDRELDSLTEACLDLSDIYPSRVGTIGSVITVDASKNFYDFTDSDPVSDPCPDYSQYLIAGETMTVIFQSGRLAGREFEVSYSHAQRRFEIVPQEMDGETMPDETFIPAQGDTYVVFHCAMPSSYIAKASDDMFRDAIRYLYENEEQKFTFSGELDGIWAKKRWVNVGGKLVLGGYVSFSDERFQQEDILVRITQIKDFINNPHSPSITLSNQTVRGGFVSAFRKAQAQEVVIEETARQTEAFTKRRFRDAQETMDMIEGLIDGYGERISPSSAQMLQLLVGDESLQYRFVDSYSSSSPTIVNPTFSFANGRFTVNGGYYCQHMTLGVSTMATSHAVGEYLYWSVQAYQSAVLDDDDTAYYLYLKCPETTGSNCEYVLSTTPIGLRSMANYYHLVVGVLGSAYEGARSFVPLYGFTEITGGRITTDRIISADGNTYFDLTNNRIGGYINFVDGLISGLIGVGNANGVNAGLNGEGTSSTDIRMWAGSAATGRATAPFRVRHDGKMYATDAEIEGKITSTEGNIGGFVLANNRIGVENNTSGTQKNNGMSLYQDLFVVRKDSSTLAAGAYMGASVFDPAAGYVASLLRLEANDTDQYLAPVEKMLGAYIDIKGAGTNEAVRIGHGTISGIRPQVKIITSSVATVDQLTYYYFINNSSNTVISIDEPYGNEEVGQTYEFIRLTTNTVTITSSVTIRRADNGATAYDFAFSSSYMHFKVVYANSMWHLLIM